MWKLTVYQNKKFDNWTAEEQIVFESEKLFELLDIICNLSKSEAPEKTWYKLEEIEKEGEGRCSSEN